MRPSVLVLVLLSATAASASPLDEINTFNRKWTQATLKMDNAAVLALWADDGVSLLPGADPISGKHNLAAFLKSVTDAMPGYHVTVQEDDCRDIDIAADRATEWCFTHQIVQPPQGKPPIETWGKTLLVLRREKDGQWRLLREMWNSRAKPKP